MSAAFEDATVGEIVARDYRTAAVFEQFGIDFCCGGRRSVVDACQSAQADPAAVEQALDALPPVETATADDDVTRWPVDRLIDHVETTHHAYVRSALRPIGAHLTTLVDVHGARHPELRRIATVFDGLGRDLLQHMLKEERVLFPYVRELAATTTPVRPNLFGTIENPIRMMQREHQQAGDEMRVIRALTNDYVTSADGCTTYRVTFDELAQFDHDLQRHVHLENNVLFPKAIALEHRPCI